MPYVPSDQFSTRGVNFKHILCFKVTGKWSDLHTLACQIKHKYVASNYTVLLVSGKQWSDEPSELIITGNINLADDPAYRLVEQRISEGFQVEFSFGNLFRSSLIYSFEEPVQEEPIQNLSNNEPPEINDHPF